MNALHETRVTAGDAHFYQRMRKLIGRRCRHLNRSCTLLEVLADNAMLVLRCEDGASPIQSDQFGQPLRRAIETLQVPIFDVDGETFSADAIELLASFAADAA